MGIYEFNPEKVRDALVEMIKDYTKKAGVTKVVIGISGGKDSSTAAALCARALGAENVYGIMMPDNIQPDLEDSVRICKTLGIHARCVNIGKIHQAIKDAVLEELAGDFFGDGSKESRAEKESNINVPPRIRMTTLRYIAQALGAFVCGTGNLSEATVGYCTKDGDTSCDFNVLGALTSLEVVQVGLSMEELPRELIIKAPSDGLSGMTDEEKLGIAYKQIHEYIRYGTCKDPAIDEKIREKNEKSAHKRRMPTVLNPFGEQ